MFFAEILAFWNKTNVELLIYQSDKNHQTDKANYLSQFQLERNAAIVSVPTLEKNVSSLLPLSLSFFFSSSMSLRKCVHTLRIGEHSKYRKPRPFNQDTRWRIWFFLLSAIDAILTRRHHKDRDCDSHVMPP